MNILKCLIGFLASVIIIVLVMPNYIKKLKSFNITQVTSEYALEDFKAKEKTPIMGGLLFIVVPVLVFAVINFKGLSDKKLLFVLLSYVLYCTVGFLDDYTIVVKHNNEGLSEKTRLLMELVYAVVLFFVFRDVIPSQVSIPFTSISVHLSWFIFLPFMVLLYMAEANAVNFTDGMDGLCAGVSFISLIPMLIFTILYKETNLTLFIICVLGGLLGYLKFNYHPAKIFMGDTGSMFIGYMMAAISVLGAFKTAATVSLIVPAIALGLPIMDTSFAILRRYTNGRPIFQPDKGHLHHRLLAMGMNQKQAVLLMYGITAMLGIAAVLWAEVNGFYAALIIAAIITAVAIGAKKIGILNDR